MSTREERHAAHIAELRAKYPQFEDSYWEQLVERQRMQWQIDDLGGGIARLAGKYTFHADQAPSNTRLAELVEELLELNQSVFDDRAAEGVAR